MNLNYFRPKARHIFTIGRDLIKDDFSALIELIKNSYDADATEVTVMFEGLSNNGLLLNVIDNGEGMSELDIRSKWLVPSTDNKVTGKTRRFQRAFQGQKGIGRYAVSVLGNLLNLETVNEGLKTTLEINWDDFNDKDKYLDEIPLVIKSESTSEKNGTKLSIIGGPEKVEIWNVTQLKRLKRELSKLISPYDEVGNFKIYLDVSSFIDIEENPEFAEKEVSLSQFEEFFDYKISGKFKKILEPANKVSGLANIKYENADTGEVVECDLPLDLNNSFFSEEIRRTFPGDFDFEFLVIDRDPIKEREEVSKRMGSARELARAKGKKEFDENYGVKLYRGGFRIRPYGESGDDWLNLDARRVNSPSTKIGNNQIAGFIRIGNEEDSGLKELTSRGGLIENECFWGLKCIIGKILNELETKKLAYRSKVGLGRKSVKKLDYDEMREGITKIVEKFEHPNKEAFSRELTTAIDNVFSKVEEREKFLEKVLFIYERQATLGKIMGELMHEIKQPLSFFKGKLKKLEEIIENLNELLKYNENVLELKEIGERYRENSLRVLRFLKTVEPLANSRRKSEYSSLYTIIDLSAEALRSKLDENKIELKIEGENYMVFGDKTDFIVAFSNFIDNSIYWLSVKSDEPAKTITITSSVEDDKLYISVKDNGVGLLKDDLKGDIFDPGVTLKEKGSGLGLSIAGEVLKRNDVSLSLLDSDEGFALQLIFPVWKK